MTKVAIVSTTKEFTTDHNFFIEHHRRIGIKRFFFFLDNPLAENSIKTLAFADDINVTICIKNDELIEIWKSFEEFESIKQDLDRLVVKRQALNVKVAQKICIEESIEWLFHIDDDELICPIGWKNIGEYLYFLPPEVNQVTVLNNEAVYCDLSYTEVFAPNLFFKKNPYTIAKSQLSIIESGVPKKYFYCSYAHGKSAIRIESLNNKPQVPAGVHMFNERSAKNFFQASPFDLAILHFPFSGVRKLFERYNGVNKRRLYQYEHLAAKNEENFYTEARKLKDWNEYECFYKLHVMHTENDLQLLQKYKLLSNITINSDCDIVTLK